MCRKMVKVWDEFQMWTLVAVLLARKLCFYCIRMKSFCHLQMVRMGGVISFSEDHQCEMEDIWLSTVLFIVQIKVSNLTSVCLCELGSGRMMEVVILDSIRPNFVS